MRRHASLGPAALERLLEGEFVEGTAVSQVIATARAAGTPEELAGLEAARAAFLQVAQQPAATRLSVNKLPAVTRTAAGRLLALKAIAAVSGATLIGGVAYAASTTGLIQTPWHHPSHQQQTSGAPDSGAATLSGSAHQLPGPGNGTSGHGHPHKPTSHPSRATTPNHGRGASVTSSARASHSPVVPPHSAAATTPTVRATAPNPPTTPTPAPTGHAQTTPAQRPTLSHSPRPAPTKP